MKNGFVVVVVAEEGEPTHILSIDAEKQVHDRLSSAMEARRDFIAETYPNRVDGQQAVLVMRLVEVTKREMDELDNENWMHGPGARRRREARLKAASNIDEEPT